MTDDRITGTARNLGGKVQEGFGKVTGDAKSEFKGKWSRRWDQPRPLRSSET
jgi:uncharacterized protein YjbJ (UPF0337 family)